MPRQSELLEIARRCELEALKRWRVAKMEADGGVSEIELTPDHYAYRPIRLIASDGEIRVVAEFLEVLAWDPRYEGAPTTAPLRTLFRGRFSGGEMLGAEKKRAISRTARTGSGAKSRWARSSGFEIMTTHGCSRRHRAVIAAGSDKGEETMRIPVRLFTYAALFVLLLVGAPMPAGAYELSGGVSMGGILAGTVPRLAVSPHAGLSWRMESGFLFAVHDLFRILLAINKDGAGVYNQTAAAIGYAWENGNLSAGPSLSIHSMPACGIALCGRVAGLSPGGHVQANVYFAGPWGVSVSANVDWIGGRSLVLPGGVAAMVVAGPVFRWSSKGIQ